MFFIKEKGLGKKRKGKHAQKNPDGMEHNPHYSTEKKGDKAWPEQYGLLHNKCEIIMKQIT